MPKLCIPDVIAPPSSRLRPSSFPALAPLADPSPAARRHHCWRPLLSGATAFVLLIIDPVANAQPITDEPPIVATTGGRFAVFVAEAAQRFGIPATWIRVVMRAESFGEVRAISPKGAMGLMQIMPETWAHLRVRYGLGADPYDPHDNILAGAAYLRELYDPLWRAWISGRLQCRSNALRGSFDDRPAASGGDTRLRRRCRSVDRRRHAR